MANCTETWLRPSVCWPPVFSSVIQGDRSAWYQRNCKIGQEPTHIYEFSPLRVDTRKARCIIHIGPRPRGYTPFPFLSDQEWIIQGTVDTLATDEKCPQYPKSVIFFGNKKTYGELILLLLGSHVWIIIWRITFLRFMIKFWSIYISCKAELVN